MGCLSRMRALLLKEFRQMLRDRGNLLIGLVLPIVLILIFGYGLSLDVSEARITAVAEDGSPAARELLATVAGAPGLRLEIVHDFAAGRAQMDAHRSDALLRVPSDFARRFEAGEASVQVLLQGGDPVRAMAIRGQLEGVVAVWAAKRADRARTSPAAGVQLLERMWFNEANNSRCYLVPGLIVLIMTLVGTFLTALVMAREWERGTLEALFVTPVRPAEVLLAKILAYFVVGLAGLALCLVAARYLFAVPLRGSLLVLLVASMIYMVVALSIGLLISALTRNQFLASQIAILASFMPSLMLSGFVFDLRNVPALVSVVGHVLPATYFVELVRTLFLAGDWWPLVLRNCAILAAYAVLLLALARALTRKRLD